MLLTKPLYVTVVVVVEMWRVRGRSYFKESLSEYARLLFSGDDFSVPRGYISFYEDPFPCPDMPTNGVQFLPLLCMLGHNIRYR